MSRFTESNPLSLNVSIQSPQLWKSALPNFIGSLGHIRRARYAKDAMDAFNTNYGDDRTNVTDYVLTGAHMSPQFMQNLPNLWSGAVNQVTKLLGGMKDARRSKFVAAMMGIPSKQAQPESLII